MRKGSITTYLSLILLVMLSLIAAGLYSARQAAGRVVLASGTEQALFSLFGQYDRDLFEAFGLLFVDGGYGGEALRPGLLLQEVEESAGYILEPKKGLFLAPGRDPVGIRLEEEQDAVTGYVLATDDGGRAFRRQVCEIMQKKLGPAGLLFLKTRLDTQQEILDTQQSVYEDLRAEQEEQAAQAEAAALAAQEQAPADPENSEAESGTGDATLLPDFANPLEAVRSMQAAGVMAMVRPQASGISAAEMTGDPVSKRTLQQGMSMVADGWEGSGERILLMEYLAENFSCYTSEREGNGLQYQVEYAVGGKRTDRENLQEVLLRLLIIREAANFIYLMSDPSKKGEADAVAETISTVILQPELQPAISAALVAAWAYGESILDLRNLLEGEKIALIKDAASWQLPLRALAFMRFTGDTYRHGSESGLGYEEYLRLLLLTRDADSLTRSLMDLTEQRIRTEYGRTGFCMDTCLDALRVELHAAVGRHEYSITRSYGYNM